MSDLKRLIFSFDTEYMSPCGAPRLILIRGCCNSGKSTLAKFLEQSIQDIDCSVTRLESDFFFYDCNGVKHYDKTKIRYAHYWCLDTAKILLNAGNVVIVANTFTKLWEMQKYIEYVREKNIPFSVLHMTKEYEAKPLTPPQSLVDYQKAQYEKFLG